MLSVFSNSKINSYKQCPRKFKLQYIDKIPVPKEAKGVEALIGTCVHNALHVLYQKANDGILLTLDNVQSLFSSQWKESIQSEIIVPKQGLTIDHFENNGLDMLGRYYLRYAPFDKTQTVALEKRIQFPLGEYQMTGYIDRVSIRKNGFFEIHDYKTTSSFPTKKDLANDTQLALYQAGILNEYPNVKEIELIWHFLKFDQEICIKKSEEEVNSIIKETISLIRKINHDAIYQPNESPLCQWCLYQEFCPAKAHEFDLLSYSSEELETGVNLVDEYAKIQQQINSLNQEKASLENQLKEVEKKAIELAKENNYSKLTGTNNSLQIKEEMDYEFPKSQELGRIHLEEWLKEKNLWNVVSMLQLSKLTKLLDNETLPIEIHDELMSFSQIVKTQKVKLLKNKKDFTTEDEVHENE